LLAASLALVAPARRARGQAPDPAPAGASAGAAALQADVGDPEGRWPERYVDRPQTIFGGMQTLALSGHDFFGGPPGYHRFLLSLGYAYGAADRWQVEAALPQLLCLHGGGAGRCVDAILGDSASLGVTGAAVRGATAMLAAGGHTGISNSHGFIEVSARLKLVARHRVSLEIEPQVWFGLSHGRTPAWWSPTATTETNQTRASLTLDLNLQVLPRLLLWAAAIPYAPTDQVFHAGQIAVQVLGGLSATLVKSFEVHGTCGSYNVLGDRRWEYVPDVRVCTLALILRSFGPGPEVGTGRKYADPSFSPGTPGS
jgi:hypothetical protein